eukprot:scpid92766/ scgid15236/ 
MAFRFSSSSPLLVVVEKLEEQISSLADTVTDRLELSAMATGRPVPVQLNTEGKGTTASDVPLAAATTCAAVYRAQGTGQTIRRENRLKCWGVRPLSREVKESRWYFFGHILHLVHVGHPRNADNEAVFPSGG